MVENRPSILVLPGIYDDVAKMQKYVLPLERHFNVSISSANWQSHEPVKDKVHRIREEIKSTESRGIIGISASGHIAIAIATNEEMKEISAIGAVSAPLRRGGHVFPTPKQIEWRRPIFYESLTKFEEEVLPHLNQEIKDKTITTRGTQDLIVPPDTSLIEGVTDVVFESNRLNIFYHMQNIIKGLQSNELQLFKKRKSQQMQN